MAHDRGTIRWHRGGWEISWYDATRRRYARHAAPNTRAGRRSAEIELERLSTTTGDPSIAEVIEDYRAVKWAGWSPSTRRNWPSTTAPLIAAFGHRPAHALTAAQIERTYATWQTEGLSPATIRRRHAVLSAALIRAERLGILAHAATRRVEVPKAPSAPPPDLPTLTATFAALDALDGPQWLTVAIRVTLATGMRRGELCALRWSDIDLDAGCLWVRAATALDEHDQAQRKATKTRRSHAAEALDARTVQILTDWQTASKTLAAKLGVRWTTTWPLIGQHADPRIPLDPPQVTRAWVHHRTKIGMDHVRWHDLRHIVASELVAAGIDPVTIAARLGHDPAMLLGRYAHARPATDQNAAQVIADADRGR